MKRTLIQQSMMTINQNNNDDSDGKKSDNTLASISPQVLLYSTLLTSSVLGATYIYKNYLRRIPNSSMLSERYMKKRKLLGVVTRVGDGDNFHLYHTPGGYALGWGWLRKIPNAGNNINAAKRPTNKISTRNNRNPLRKETLHIRLSGVDAPECAHFGRPAQPFSQDALQWLRSTILGRRVSVLPLKTDQYGRTVGEVYVRGSKWYNFFRKFNVSAEMLRNGWATLYEAKSGAEFNGKKDFFKSLEAEAQRKKRGIFVQGNRLVTPRQYKDNFK